MSQSIAKVVVDLALNREFDYRIPPALAGLVHIGSRVAVPFGKRTAQGYVVNLTDSSPYPQLKDLGEVVGKTATEDLLDVIFNQFCIGK